MGPPLIVFLDRGTIPGDAPFPRPRAPHRWQEHDATSPDQIAARLSGATVAITNKVPLRRDVLEQLPGLRMIAVAASGTDVIDIPAAQRLGIEVANVRGYAAGSVAEHVFALALALRRNLVPHAAAAVDGSWQASGRFACFVAPIADLDGAVLGVVGSGAIGTRVADIGRAFGMEVLQSERPGADKVRGGRVAFEEVLRRADVLSLHLPLTADTRGLIDRAALFAMKRSAILINTARGGLVDSSALAEALAAGRIAGAGLDATDPEPPLTGDPLLPLAGSPALLITPHVAWGGERALVALRDGVVSNIERHLASAAEQP